jgi:SAM-dependent methyltransferase
LIPEAYREGRLLDIGSGTYPLFLLGTKFSEKYGLERLHLGAHERDLDASNVTMVRADLESDPVLPFDAEYFDVVTMLAVFEHIGTQQLIPLVGEIHRVLKPGGMYVMTTPAVWTRGLLRLMSRVGMLSAAEIDEHKGSYARARIASILMEGGFPADHLRSGYFEVFMNVWAAAVK